MKKLVLFCFALSLVRLFTIYEVLSLGELVKFNGSVYIVTGGVNRGLTATQIK